MAAPVVALEVDGAIYAVAALERLWGIDPGIRATDFHARVVSTRAAGLEGLNDRLRAGTRPTETRFVEGSYLPLPPCDSDRAAYWQMGPYDVGSETPVFQQRDARALVGDGQPVVYPPGTEKVGCEVGLAVVLAEDLQRAAPPEADRAILGFCLCIDWTSWPDRWAWQRADAPTTLGPCLLLSPALGEIASLHATLSVGGSERPAGRVGAWRFRPAESLSYLSQYVELRAGDVVGLGCFAGGRLDTGAITLRAGVSTNVSVSVERTLTLRGFAVAGPPLGEWRQLDGS
jgi:hypothetical protein